MFSELSSRYAVICGPGKSGKTQFFKALTGYQGETNSKFNYEAINLSEKLRLTIVDEGPESKSVQLSQVNKSTRFILYVHDLMQPLNSEKIEEYIRYKTQISSDATVYIIGNMREEQKSEETQRQLQEFAHSHNYFYLELNPRKLGNEITSFKNHLKTIVEECENYQLPYSLYSKIMAAVTKLIQLGEGQRVSLTDEDKSLIGMYNHFAQHKYVDAAKAHNNITTHSMLRNALEKNSVVNSVLRRVDVIDKAYKELAQQIPALQKKGFFETATDKFLAWMSSFDDKPGPPRDRSL